MKTKTKIWLIIASSLVLIGCIIFAGAMTTLKWDFTKLATVKYETNTYEIGETFDSISINTDTADIIFALSDDGNCRVECHEEENSKYCVTVEDGTLNVEFIDERSVYHFIGYIGLNFDSPKITVYLPNDKYESLDINEDTGDITIPDCFSFGDINIELSTGNVDCYPSASDKIKITTSTGYIDVENLTTDTLDLTTSTGAITVGDVTCENDVTVNVSTGKSYLSNVECNNFVSDGNTGELTLKNVIADRKFLIERSTGDVKFEFSDADEIYVITDTGDVTGSLLTDKVFVTKTDTGDVDVPKTIDGGRCEVSTNTGDIVISIAD